MNSANSNQENSKPARTGDGVVSVRLRSVELRDLPTLFEFQLDPEANRVAAIIPRSENEFDEHWEKVLDDPSVTAKVILVGDVLAGCISCFYSEGYDYVGYWIGREFSGRGVATRALELLLNQVSVRPLHARVAVENRASIRVLQKCGFTITHYQKSPADGRFAECEEAFLELTHHVREC